MDDLTHTEGSYRSTLTKLSLLEQTQQVRRLIAHHQQFLKVQDTEGLLQWLERGVGIYAAYIPSYDINVGTLDCEISLKKAPLIRLNQLFKVCCSVNALLANEYKQLVSEAKDRVEAINLEIDLNTFCFDDVKDLTTGGPTVAYFQLEQVRQRDYFQMEMAGDDVLEDYDELCEIFLLKNNMVAITRLLHPGRSLLFPLISANFELAQDGFTIAMEGKTITLKCPDNEQVNDWIDLLGALPSQSGFDKRHNKLLHLKNDKVGLGLSTSQLHRSSPMISKDSILRSSLNSELNMDQYFGPSVDLFQLNSKSDILRSPVGHIQTPRLKKQDTPHIETDIFKPEQVVAYPELNPLDDIVEKEDTKKEDTKKEKDIKKETKKEKTNKQGKEKKKNRKSLFNLFSKSPSFEIVTKPMEELTIDPFTPQEQAAISLSKLSHTMNHCTVSQWSKTRWNPLGKTLQFYTGDYNSMCVVDDGPVKFVPLTHITVNKSARDVQVKYLSLSQEWENITIRCPDSKTVSVLIDSLHNEPLSASSSGIFESTSFKSDDYQHKSSSTLSLRAELLLITQKVKLHQMDADGDWIPVSMGKLSLYSNVSQHDTSKLKVHCSNGVTVESTVLNSDCSRLGKSGLRFDGEYLLEFKSIKECSEVYDLLC